MVRRIRGDDEGPLRDPVPAAGGRLTGDSEAGDVTEMGNWYEQSRAGLLAPLSLSPPQRLCSGTSLRHILSLSLSLSLSLFGLAGWLAGCLSLPLPLSVSLSRHCPQSCPPPTPLPPPSLPPSPPPFLPPSSLARSLSLTLPLSISPTHTHPSLSLPEAIMLVSLALSTPYLTSWPCKACRAARREAGPEPPRPQPRLAAPL